MARTISLYGRSIIAWLCFNFLFLNDLQAQSDSARKRFSFSGYLEGYYSYDFARPEDKQKPSCFYSFNRHNEPNINLALLKGSYLSPAFRMNAAFMAGTYSRYNLAAEPGLLQHIFELNAGVKIGRKSLWLDAGVLPSHIGLEGAIGKDFWSLTRSLMADNSPYVESGMKLGFDSDNGRWYVALLLLNGWQRIKTLEGNTLPSFGHQLQFKPNAKILINSSSFIGTDKPDSVRKMRYFHDLYAIFQLNEKISLQAAFDIGMEQKQKGSGSYHAWHTMLAGVQYKWTGKIRTSARLEYYRDKAGVIVSSETGLPFSVWGVSANTDYQILPNLLWRLELRGLSGREGMFLKQGIAVQSNSAITVSLAFHF
jgi:hypothetical protein